MKTLTPIALLLALVASAQDQESPAVSRTVFKVSPFHFVQNTLKVGIEAFDVSHSKSLSINVGVRTGNDDDPYYGSGDYNGVLGEIQVRKYVSPLKTYTSRRNHAYMQGVYAGVFVQGGSYSSDRTYVEYTYDPNTGSTPSATYRYSEEVWNGALGFTLGAQRVFWNVIFIDVYIGGGLQIAGQTFSGQIPPDPYYDYNDPFAPGHEGVIPKIGIQIGLGL